MKKLKSQIKEINLLLKQANTDYENYTWNSKNPEYPNSVIELMSFISKSDWLHSHYNKFDKNEILENIDSANFEAVMAAITYVNRSEKWSTGAWNMHMKKQTLVPIVRRAEVLLDTLPWYMKFFPIKRYGPNST